MISLDPIVRERYASAILNIARRQNIREQLLEDAQVLLEVIKALPHALVMIEAPQFKQERKVAFLDRTLKGKFHEVIERLVYLLLERHRIEYLGAVLKRFVVLVELDLGIRPATLTTAIELTDDQKAHLQTKLEAYTKSRLHIKYVVDPSVIAGVRFRCGDLLLDDTVAWRLEIISRSLHDAARRVDVAA